MSKQTKIHACKYALHNFRCGNCETGVVQLHQEWKRGGNITSVISGCLDCGHEYGIYQAGNLKALSPETETRWP